MVVPFALPVPRAVFVPYKRYFRILEGKRHIIHRIVTAIISAAMRIEKKFPHFMFACPCIPCANADPFGNPFALFYSRLEHVSMPRNKARDAPLGRVEQKQHDDESDAYACTKQNTPFPLHLAIPSYIPRLYARITASQGTNASTTYQ